MTDTLAEHFAGQMGRLLGPDFPEHIALAVSGGGDSMAMLALAHEWARVFGVGLRVVTVDHGLREASAQEAVMVAQECAVLGHPHTTLQWHWDGKGNLQDAARRARLSLIDGWRGATAHVLFAHTQDDVAETFLMRLARGSGVEGLSAMAEQRFVQMRWNEEFEVIRPLLNTSRADLRHYIDAFQVPYVNDPSNEDPRFDRVRVRRALAELGIDAAKISQTAQRMARASEALALRASEVARECVQEGKWGHSPIGDLIVDRDAFATVDIETQLRVLAAALKWVSSAEYRPRAAPLEALLDRALSGGGGTLHGARVIVSGAHLRICREYEAVKALSVQMDGPTVWDRRWTVISPEHDGFSLRALGPDGWQQLADKPEGAPPHDAAIALPALFDGARLVACNAIAGRLMDDTNLLPPRGSFIASLLSR